MNSASTEMQAAIKLSVGATVDFMGWMIVNHPELAEEGISLIEDSDPDRSLLESADRPFSFYNTRLFSEKITPRRKWAQVGALSKYWPKAVARQARLLGVGRDKLPCWKQITAYFSSIGFRAVPVRGYVGGPMYMFLLTKGMVPVCTQWVLRYRRAPYYLLPTDTFHDLGHGFAMAMSDYAELAQRFALKVLQKPEIAALPAVSHRYGRLFEHAYVRDPDGRVEPIGAASIVFETLQERRGRLQPIIRDPAAMASQRDEYQPFLSRNDWLREAEKCIQAL